MSEGFHLQWLNCGQMKERFQTRAPGSLYQNRIVGHIFCWTSQGRETHIVDGKRYTAGPADVFLFRPGQLVVTEADPLESSLSHSIAMGIASLPEDWPKPSTWPVKRRMQDDDVLRPLFEFVVANTPDKQVEGVSTVLSLTVQSMLAIFLFGPFGRQHNSARPYPAAVQRVIEWMQELTVNAPGAKLTLADIAAVSGVSTKHFCRLFNKHIGYPPMEALYLYRLTRSLIGLRMGKKVEVIAYELGFADASHYARRFRALFGKSPEEMRQAIAKGYKPKMPKLPHMT